MISFEPYEERKHIVEARRVIYIKFGSLFIISHSIKNLLSHAENIFESTKQRRCSGPEQEKAKQ